MSVACLMRAMADSKRRLLTVAERSRWLHYRTGAGAIDAVEQATLGSHDSNGRCGQHPKRMGTSRILSTVHPKSICIGTATESISGLGRASLHSDDSAATDDQGTPKVVPSG